MPVDDRTNQDPPTTADRPSPPGTAVRNRTENSLHVCHPSIRGSVARDCCAYMYESGICIGTTTRDRNHDLGTLRDCQNHLTGLVVSLGTRHYMICTSMCFPEHYTDMPATVEKTPKFCFDNTLSSREGSRAKPNLHVLFLSHKSRLGPRADFASLRFTFYATRSMEDVGSWDVAIGNRVNIGFVAKLK